MKEQMTLGELMNLMPLVSEGRVPGKKQVQMGSHVICSSRVQGMTLTVFDNGYVLGEDARGWTVFPVEECRGYEYEFINGEEFLSASIFEGLSWEIRILMEADDRIARNTEDELEEWLERHPNYKEELVIYLQEPISPEDAYLIKEEVEERMNKLTDKEKEAVVLWNNGMRIAEIADFKSMTVAAVKTRLWKAVKKLYAA